MKVLLDVNLRKLLEQDVDTGNLVFNKIKNLTNWTYSGLSADLVYQLAFIGGGGPNTILMIFRNNGTEETPVLVPVATLLGNNILNVSILETLNFEAEIGTEGSINSLRNYFKYGIATIYNIEEENKTSLILYRLNDERDHINKNLIPVDFILGNFKSPLGIKRIEIDMENYEIEEIYNYVYIPKLKRYYYVTDIQFMNNAFTRLILQEDVLMSWKTLILYQNAFITRYENSTRDNLVDERRPLSNILTTGIMYATHTSSEESVKNIDFSTIDDQAISVPNFIIVTRDNRPVGYSEGAITPSIDSSLSSLAPHNSPNMNVYFTSYAYLGNFIQACMNDSPTTSYLDSIIYLPFDPRQAFNLNDIGRNNLYIGDKQLNYESASFVSASKTIPLNELPHISYNTVDTYRDIYQSAYLCIFDGKFISDPDRWTDHEPYTNYEINIPFVGFVKVNSYDILNQRILIYYSMDLKNGSATAFIYNKDNKTVIWSGACQLGTKLDITATNNLENLKQKQSADLNMILGLIASTVSIGVGIASENPVAVAGGVLSAGKTIASNVNANRMLFSRAQTTFGSGDASLYSRLSVFIKKTTYSYLSIDYNVYKHLQGLPYNNYSGLALLSGYVEVGEIHFDAKGYDIYSTEIDEIVQLLKGGVIL